MNVRSLAFASVTSLVLVAGCAAEPTDEVAESAAQDLVSATSAYSDVGIQHPLDACAVSHEPTSESDYRGWRWDCGSMGGYTLVANLAEEHGAEVLVRTPTGTFNLDISQGLQKFSGYARLNGYFGKKAEWRGRGIAIGQVDPSALILRYFFTDVPNGSNDWRDNNALAVVKLTPTGACIYDAVSGAVPNHNQLARDIADSEAFKSFTCPTTTPEPLAPSACGRLKANEGMWWDEALTSCSGSHSLIMQSDGNLVLYNNRTGRATWSSRTAGLEANAAILRPNGQLGVYGSEMTPIFETPTNSEDASLAVQDDGNVVIYAKNGRPVWATNTQGK